MTRILISWVFTLTIAFSGFAQDDAHSYPPMRKFSSDRYALDLSTLPAGRWSLWLPDSGTQQALWRPFDIPTMGVQTLTGIAAIAIVGAVVFPLAGSPDNSKDIGPQIVIFLIGAPAAAIAFPTGVYFGGKWMGGNGSYIWTLIGGFGAGGVALLPNIIEGSGEETATVIRTAVAVLAGALLGYHLSSSPVCESGTKESEESRFPEQWDPLTLNRRHRGTQIKILSINL